jgi:hypothetical protein
MSYICIINKKVMEELGLILAVTFISDVIEELKNSKQ